LEIEIPPEVVKKRAGEIATEFRRHARLPGFRPGKAPLSLIQQRYRDDIRSELLRALVPEYVEAQAKEQKWDPVGSPSISDVEYAEDSPLRFKATLEVLPQFELRDFRSLEVAVAETAVSNEEIENTLSELQEEGATFVNVEESRPLADGDHASIAITEVGAGSDAPSGKTRELFCEIGGVRTMKEFSDNLRGASLGEERTFTVSYPAEARDPRIAGKSVTYCVKVLGLKKKQLPELNDEFARELGDYDSLEAVRRRIREDLEKAKQHEASQSARAELRKKLAELHDFPVPEALVERQIEKRLDTLKREIEAKKLNPQLLQLDWGRLRTAQRQAAVEDVKSSLVLEKIAEANNLEAGASDLSEEIQGIADATRQSPEAVEAYLTRDGGLARIKSRLRIDKALEFVFQNVRRISKNDIAVSSEG
jgi:trigger factor